MLNIEPIKLLRGSHPDTGTTGQGCVMNVIAYLNGEPQITDQSPCVCFVARPILIWLNDALTDDQRHRLIPYIERAMGSRNDDPAVFVPRSRAAAEWAAKWAAKWAAEWAAVWAAELVAKREGWECWEEELAAKAAKAAAMSVKAAKAKSVKEAEAAADAAAELAVKVAKMAKWAVMSAGWVAKSEGWVADVIDSAFSLLDEILPQAPTQQPDVVVERARALTVLAA